MRSARSRVLRVICRSCEALSLFMHVHVHVHVHVRVRVHVGVGVGVSVGLNVVCAYAFPFDCAGLSLLLCITFVLLSQDSGVT